jgi:hypothetical protein
MRATSLFCIVLAALSLPAAILLDAPGHVSIENGKVIARGGVPGVAYEIVDWRGRSAGASGTWGSDGTAVLPRLPAGYYHIRSGQDSATLAVVPPPETRSFDHASFYATDSAQSWISRKGRFYCPWNGGDTFLTVSDLLRLCGIPNVRERLSWSEVNPRQGVFNCAHYMYNADLLRARGILVSGMFHDSPKWAGRIKKLPSDLNAVFSFCSGVASAFGDRMGDWEFWNEQDIGFAPEPVWDYAAALKAAYLGFKAGRSGVVVLPGALCQAPDSGYARALYANDAAKFGDVYNYHTYDAPANYPRKFAALRAFMERYGIGDRAIWMTESGTNLEGHSDKPGAKKGMMAHSPEQELVIAEFYPKSQIAFQMEGVARNYYFVFGAYNERNGKKDWGVMRRDGTVKPTYAAISTMTRELISARLLGEMTVGEGLRAYLFAQPDGSQTVAYWSVSPMDTKGNGIVRPVPDFAKELTLPVANGSYRVSDLCGMRSTVTVTNGVLALSSTRFPSYVAGLHGLAVQKHPFPAGKVKPYVPAADEDLTVIVRVDLNTNDFVVTGQKTGTILTDDTGRLRVQVWNMGDSAKTGRLDVAGGTLEGLPGTIALGPRGAPPATYDCTYVAPVSDESEQKLVLSGVFEGKRSSRLVMPVHLEKRFLASCTRTPIAWKDPKNWTRNTSAQSYSAAWDEVEKAMRFDLAWTDPGIDRWFYPIYKLKMPEENLAGAVQIRFEVKSAQDKVENDFSTQNLMLVFKDKAKTARFIPYNAPLGSWEIRTVELNEVDSLDDVVSFRLGANPKGMKCTFWVRNIEILRTTKFSFSPLR